MEKEFFTEIDNYVIGTKSKVIDKIKEQIKLFLDDDSYELANEYLKVIDDILNHSSKVVVLLLNVVNFDIYILNEKETKEVISNYVINGQINLTQ